MFKRKTVIVVGAGASSEVGLPAGDALKTSITAKLNFKFSLDQWKQPIQLSGDRQIAHILYHLPLAPKDGKLANFFEDAKKLRLILPQALSIDTVLDSHNDDDGIVTCGKLGIVSTIIEAERNSNLFHQVDNPDPFDFNRSEKTWFHNFFKILNEGIHQTNVDDIFKNLTFIIFNYDRCIEFYLSEAVANYYYKLTPDQVTKLMSSLRIFHPYGSIGSLNWRGTGTTKDISFGSESYDLTASSRMIKTYTERVDDGPELKEMRKSIQDAEKLIFLGFAFHEQNMNLLSTLASSVREVYGTAFKISNSDREVIKETIKKNLNSVDSAIVINLRQDLTCADLFQEYRLSLMQ